MSAVREAKAEIPRLALATRLDRPLRECAPPFRLKLLRKTSGAAPIEKRELPQMFHSNAIQRLADDSERLLSGEMEVNHRDSARPVLELLQPK